MLADKLLELRKLIELNYLDKKIIIKTSLVFKFFIASNYRDIVESWLVLVFWVAIDGLIGNVHIDHWSWEAFHVVFDTFLVDVRRTSSNQ